MINYVYQLVSPKVLSIKYEDVALEDRVIVRPKCMGVCHADQRYYQGLRELSKLQEKLPMVLIHEACGEVVHDPTGTFARGDRVVLIPNIPGNGPDFIYENYAEGSRFLSSGYDGFMREFVDLPADRVVACGGIPEQAAAITEFVSVACHALERFGRAAHAQRRRIGVWGDGSLSYVVCCAMKKLFPDAEIAVVGMDPRKLSQFTFVHETHYVNSIPSGFRVDHAFECCGGEGSGNAIDDIIRYIRPQGTVMLMGVSENKVAVNTRNVLEKGLTMIGCSRSGRADFERAVGLMLDATFHNRLSAIIYEDLPVSGIADIGRVMATDLTTPFKTVFRWNV